MTYKLCLTHIRAASALMSVSGYAFIRERRIFLESALSLSLYLLLGLLYQRYFPLQTPGSHASNLTFGLTEQDAWNGQPSSKPHLAN